MNDTTPEALDPEAMGREAHDVGRGVDTNPFPALTDEKRHRLWNDGWNAAAEEAAGEDDGDEGEDA